MNNRRWVRDDEKKRTPRRKKIKQPRSRPLTYNQLDALKHSTNLPISIIRNFHMYLDMGKITKTTPIDVIVRNKFLPWDKKVLLEKKDVRMTHTKYFDLKWDYYKLTFEEPDKCNIARLPKLKWDEKAIEAIGLNNFCAAHLIFILKKYSYLHWDWYTATEKVTLLNIIENPSLPWNKNALRYKLENEGGSTLFMTALITLPVELIDWENMTETVSWVNIGKYPDLPWNFSEKHCCNCGSPCDNFPPLWVLRKLKEKPLNWCQISLNYQFTSIYDNKDIPWDEKAIVNNSYDDIPIWFIFATDYKWDMKRLTNHVSWKTIISRPDIKWDVETMTNTENPSLENPPVEILSRYSDLKWNWDKYSEEFEYNDILDYHHLHWNWDLIAKRNNIPFDFAIKFPEKNWEYDRINAGNEDEIIVESLRVLKFSFTADIGLLIFNKIYC